MTSRDCIPVVAADDDRIAGADWMSRLVARLPMGQRKVLVLRYFEDLTVAEVAIILDCSEGNVKSQTHRGLTALQRLMEARTALTPKENEHAQR